MITYPQITITSQPTLPHTPTKRLVSLQVDRPGRWLLHVWLTGSPLPTVISPAGMVAVEPPMPVTRVTDSSGLATIELTSATRAGWFVQATVLGSAQSSSGAPDGGAFLVGEAAEAVAVSGQAFADWAALGTTQLFQTPAAGSSYTYSFSPAPSIANIVFAYPDNLGDVTSVSQGSTGFQVRDSWGAPSFYTTWNSRTYRVYQHVPFLPWTLPDTFTITI